MNINGILSIIVALAMMLSGGFNAEQPEALSARTLTLRDVTINMGENAVQLTPAISMGAMSENGEAVLDFHIETEEGQIFPVQLAVDEENATLSLVNSGKSFSISNDTLVKVLKEMGVDLSEIQNFNLEETLEKLYQDMIADMDEDEKEIFDHLFNDLLPKGIEMFEYMADPANEAQIKADMEGVNQEMRAMGGEGVPGIAEHNDKEYNVTTYEYTLDYDAIMAMVDKVYTANEKMREFYDSYFALMNLIIDQQNRAIESINMQMMEDMSAAEADAAVAAPESAPVQHYDFGQSSLSVLRPVSAMVEIEPPVPAPTAIPTPEPSLMPTFAPIESFADIYAMLDMDIDMTMECVETVSDDGEYVQADIVMRLSFPELEEPAEYTVSSLQVGDEIMAAMDMSFEQDGQYVNMECVAYQAEGENQFGFAMEMGEMEEDYEINEATGESELVTTMETLMGVSVSLESALNPETGKTEYSGGFAVESDDVQAVLSAGGEADEAGNSVTEVVAGYAEDDVENYISFILEVSAEPFENFAANMDNTEITSGLIDIFTGKAPAASIGIIGGADGPTSVYVTEPESGFNAGGSFFGNLQPAATPEPTLSPEQQAMADLQADLEAVIASFQKDAIALMADESVKDAASLITLGYIYEEPAEEDYEDEDYEAEDYEAYSGSSSLIEAVGSETAEEYPYEEPEADEEDAAEASKPGKLNPQFSYIPEGYKLDEEDVDLEYGSYSYSFANPETYDSIYVGLYVSEYMDQGKTYVVAEDGSLTPVEGRVVEVEDEGDGAVYVEIKDGAVNVGISVYDEDFSMDELAKFIAGLTY